MSLSKEDASYSLTIEIPAPIEFVLLQSNAPVQLIDVEKSSAVVSFSQCDPSVSDHLYLNMIVFKKVRFYLIKLHFFSLEIKGWKLSVGHLPLSSGCQSFGFEIPYDRRITWHIASIHNAKYSAESVTATGALYQTVVIAHANPFVRQ